MVHIPDVSSVDMLEECQETTAQRLEALMACVNDLETINRSIDLITQRFQQKTAAKDKARLARGWLRKESSRYPGRFYYVNTETGETSWKAPKLSAAGAQPSEKKSTRPLGKGTPAVLQRVSLSDSERSTDVGSDSD